MTEAPGPLRRWVLAARVRTLPAAMVPVIVGVSLIRPRTINWGNSALCLVVALALQVGTNYAHDYSDGVRVVLPRRRCGTAARLSDVVVAGGDWRHGDRGRVVLHRRTATVRLLRV